MNCCEIQLLAIWLHPVMSDQLFRVIIADRHEIFREGLKSVFESIDWMSVSGEAEEVEGLTRVLLSAECELIFADVSLGDRERQSIVISVRRAAPNVGLVLVADETDLDRLTEALRLGADGFIRRDARAHEFIMALEKVAAGHQYIQPELIMRLITGPDGGIGPTIDLTHRQLRILQRLAEGISNKEMGHELGVSETTVKSDLRVVFAKLGVAGRAEAVAVAMRLGLVD